MSVGLGIDFNLFEYVMTVFGENRKKISQNHLVDLEISSVKRAFLGKEKEFSRNLFVTL
jgi:hypothetical protein